MTILEASSFLVVDEYGIDPLRDKSHDAVMSVRNYTWHVVKPEERHNAPLIAYNAYSNPEYWRYIMMYNGIMDMFEIKEGMRLRIPAQQTLVSLLNDVLAIRPNTVKTVRI